jgi:hypothetical protein
MPRYLIDTSRRTSGFGIAGMMWFVSTTGDFPNYKTAFDQISLQEAYIFRQMIRKSLIGVLTDRTRIQMGCKRYVSSPELIQFVYVFYAVTLNLKCSASPQPADKADTNTT